MEHLKNAWKSWTIWFNSLLAALIALVPVIQDQLPQLAQLLPGDVYKNLTILLVVGNIILRAKTNSSLADK